MTTEEKTEKKPARQKKATQTANVEPKPEETPEQKQESKPEETPEQKQESKPEEAIELKPEVNLTISVANNGACDVLEPCTKALIESYSIAEILCTNTTQKTQAIANIKQLIELGSLLEIL